MEMKLFFIFIHLVKAIEEVATNLDKIWSF